MKKENRWNNTLRINSYLFLLHRSRIPECLHLNPTILQHAFRQRIHWNKATIDYHVSIHGIQDCDTDHTVVGSNCKDHRLIVCPYPMRMLQHQSMSNNLKHNLSFIMMRNNEWHNTFWSFHDDFPIMSPTLPSTITHFCIQAFYTTSIMTCF